MSINATKMPLMIASAPNFVFLSLRLEGKEKRH